MPNDYGAAHKARKDAGQAKDNNSMKIEVDGGYVDATDPNHIKLTEPPRSPIPQDDPFHKYRVEKS